MTMRIVLDLSEKDLTHFRNLARKALEASQSHSPEEIVGSARKLIKEVGDSESSDFISERLEQVRTLVEMLEDSGWGMQEVGRKRVLAALAYFNQPEDLIPDSIPGIGFLDDAIMIELLSRELKPEIDAYQDFVKYRADEAKRLGKDPAELDRGDYLKAREQALLSRMRRRRRAGRGSPGGSGKTPFSLF